MSYEIAALRLVHNTVLETRIRQLRRCPAVVCPMIKTLDQRIETQRQLVEKILDKYDMTIEDLMRIAPTKIVACDVELQLCYNILRDCDYIDSLR